MSEEKFPDIREAFKRKKQLPNDSWCEIFDDDQDDPKQKTFRRSSLKSPFRVAENSLNGSKLVQEWTSRFSEFNAVSVPKMKKSLHKQEQTEKDGAKDISGMLLQNVNNPCQSSFHYELDAASLCSDGSELISQTFETPKKASDFEESIIIASDSPTKTPQKTLCDETAEVIFETPDFKLKASCGSPKREECFEDSEILTVSSVESPKVSLETSAASRGTNWLQGVSWKMAKPDWNREADKTFQLIDSQKPNRKAISGGFVEQLNKVLSRESSNRNMWKHESLREIKHDKGVSKKKKKSMTVCVNKITSDKGLFHAECDVIATCALNAETVSFSDCIIVLNQDTNPDLAITAGTILKIHPPWQKLRYPSGTVLILSVYFMEVVEKCSPKRRVEEILFEWSCSCRELNLNPKSCLCYIKTPRSPKSDSSDDTPLVATQKKSPAFRTIKNETPSQSPKSETGSQHRLYSILRSVEETGGCNRQSSNPITVEGRLEEIWEVKNMLGKCKLRWQLLLKDREDVYCRLDLPPILKVDDERDVWARLTKSDTGRWYRFSGLCVNGRLTSESSDHVFEIIKQFTSNETMQPFCYIFKCFRGDSKYVELCV